MEGGCRPRCKPESANGLLHQSDGLSGCDDSRYYRHVRPVYRMDGKENHSHSRTVTHADPRKLHIFQRYRNPGMGSGTARDQCGGITDNGQTQLVPKRGGKLEFDIVPSSSHGWQDTGCRFPTFVIGTTYNEELYYVNSSSGALSIEYVDINGSLCSIPTSLQNVAGATLGWSPSEAVVAFQPDANKSAVAYNAVVTISAWTW